MVIILGKWLQSPLSSSSSQHHSTGAMLSATQPCLQSLYVSKAAHFSSFKLKEILHESTPDSGQKKVLSHYSAATFPYPIPGTCQFQSLLVVTYEF